MGNLGRYQEITTLAKKLGGVDQLIKSIEFDAVKKAAPVLLGLGALIGVGARPCIDVSKRGWRKYKKSGAVAEEAKEQLKTIVEESMHAEHGDDGPTEDSNMLDDET